jgi:hypothetical protein
MHILGSIHVKCHASLGYVIPASKLCMYKCVEKLAPFLHAEMLLAKLRGIALLTHKL